MNVGIVGCGGIANHHIPSILQDERVRTVSIADLDRSKAVDAAKRFGLTNPYSEFETMRKEQDLDVVHILTPPQTHAPLAIQAMESGCHALVEKPMALAVEDAEAMLATASRHRVKLCVDHNLLFSPTILKAQESVEAGEVGRIVHVEIHYNFDIQRLPNLRTDSRAEWALQLPAGLLSDLMAHPISLLLNFVTYPTRTHTIRKCNGILPGNTVDELSVLCDAGDATGLLSISLGTRPDCFTVHIYGTEMTIHANLTNMTLVKRRNRNVPKAIMRALDNLEQATQLFAGTLSNTVKMLMNKLRPLGDVGPVIHGFYDSIERGTEPPVSGEAGKETVELMNCIWNS